MPSPTTNLAALGDLFQAPFIARQENTPTQRSINLRHLETLIVQDNNLENTNFIVTQRLERIKLQQNDILIGIRAQPIRASLIPPELAGCFPGQNLGILRPKANINPIYLCTILRSSLGQQRTSTLFSQSTVKLINLRDLGSIEIPTPTLAIQQQIADIALAFEHELKTRQTELEQRQKVVEQFILKLTDP